MRVAPEFFWEEGACRSTNPEQVGQTSQSSYKGFIETSGECFSFGKTEQDGHIQGSRKMRVAPDIFWEEGACRSTNPEQVGRTSQSSHKGFFETSGECFSFGKTEHGGHIQGSRKMRVIPEIFWEEEMQGSGRMFFLSEKLSKADFASTMWHSMALLNSIYYNSRKKSTV